MSAILRILILCVLSIVMGGCFQPVVIHDKKMYAGFFEQNKESYKGAEYSKANGVGFRLGLLAFGIGYYDLQYLKIDKQIATEIESPIASVLIGFESDPFTYLKLRGDK